MQLLGCIRHAAMEQAGRGIQLSWFSCELGVAAVAAKAGEGWHCNDIGMMPS